MANRSGPEDHNIQELLLHFELLHFAQVIIVLGKGLKVFWYSTDQFFYCKISALVGLSYLDDIIGRCKSPKDHVGVSVIE